MKIFIILISVVVVLAGGSSADLAPSLARRINGNHSLVNPTLVTIDRGAVCLHGNPATYYYSKGFGKGSKNWIVYLPGGGWCSDFANCNAYIKNKGVGTDPKPITFGYIFSNEKQKNPDFFNWNRVVVRYCDASSFTSNSKITDENGDTIYLRGARIFKAVMEELLGLGMGNARNAILAGSSAGGVATAIYCDRFRGLIPSASRVKCLSDGGYFFLAKNHSQGNQFLSYFEALTKIQGSKTALPESCTTKLSAELCFFPPNLLANIKTPIFFFMSEFDRVQIEYTLGKDFVTCIEQRNCSSNQLKAMQDLRTELLPVLPNGGKNSKNGLLITSPFAHTRLFDPSWYFPVPGTKKTYDELFRDWYFDRKSVRVIDNYTCPYHCYVHQCLK
ncbi:PREDICTED: pectin acetylesterase 8-like isoform X2 [Ipomoea nil]|uniref:pectin acetylesterase 8-like isoform X2 n=1 Tax=Ipomoea nil TaxID=35883 RepID=UPI000901F15E|nr:PREDICTED: pectin acetylesterase 8-like isoform X2 [Ipomoea nil]